MALSPVSRSSNIYDSQIFEPFQDSSSELPFDDPVIDPHGCKFRKDYIIEWLSKNHTCPYTRQPLQADELIPIRDLPRLRKENEELRKENQKLREDHKILSKKIEDLSAKIEPKEDSKIVPVFEKIIKETNINNCK